MEPGLQENSQAVQCLNLLDTYFEKSDNHVSLHFFFKVCPTFCESVYNIPLVFSLKLKNKKMQNEMAFRKSSQQ